MYIHSNNKTSGGSEGGHEGGARGSEKVGNFEKCRKNVGKVEKSCHRPVCSSTCGITRCVLTLRRRRASNGLQNLRNSRFTSGILSKISTLIGSFFPWASFALLCSKTRSAIATGHFPLPPLQQVQVSNQNIQKLQAGNENFLDFN